MDYAITFACYNQVDYNRQCIDSMQRAGTPLERLVVVDNASGDETLAYLRGLPLGKVIHNRDNLGCGVAWNQGALELQSEWKGLFSRSAASHALELSSIDSPTFPSFVR